MNLKILSISSLGIVNPKTLSISNHDNRNSKFAPNYSLDNFEHNIVSHRTESNSKKFSKNKENEKMFNIINKSKSIVSYNNQDLILKTPEIIESNLDNIIPENNIINENVQENTRFSLVHKINLQNFDEYDHDKLINSPLSLKICKDNGIDICRLYFISKDYFVSTIHLEFIEPFIQKFEEFRQLSYEQYENQRHILIQQLRKIRQGLMIQSKKKSILHMKVIILLGTFNQF